MAGFVPIAVVPAEGTIVELGAKKNLCWRSTFTRTSSSAEPNEKESSIEDAELTAEDVDDLGDFAADIAEQPLRGHRSTRRRSLYDWNETEEIPQEFHSDAAEGKIADKHMKKSLLRKTQLI
jgi:hypothetical protein